MKIGIDGAPLTIPFPCGTKRYAGELLSRLAEIDNVSDYVIFASKKVELPDQANFSLVKIPQVLPVLKRQLFLAGKARQERVDLFHYLEPYGAIFFRHPKIVTTVHDINLDYTYPWMSKKVITRLYCEVTRFGVMRNSHTMIAVSDAVNKEVSRYLSKLNIKADVVTVCQGLGKGFKTMKGKNKGENFFLAIGDFTPRKNGGRVVEAYARLPKVVRQKYRLKIIVSDAAFTPSFHQKIAEQRVGKSVDVLVNVSQTELIDLYQNALVFIYPSLYEGFGLPILEAMACGCPVITTNWGAMREVAGKAALLVNSNSVSNIRKAMKRIVDDKNLRTMLVKTGMVRVRRFTWRKTAENTLEVYEKVMGYKND